MVVSILQQSQEISKTGRAALAYAERFSWAILPLHGIRDGGCTCGRGDCSSPAKHPLTKSGVKNGTKDIRVISAWWKRWPWANVGLATGAVSGVFVVDVDGPAGEESLEELEREHGKLPHTVEQITGGGGRHVLFRCPDFEVPNKVALVPGIDIRSTGGFVVAAPSVHISGKHYTWEISSRPGEVPLAEPPAWLLTMLRPTKATGQGRTSSEWQQLATTPAYEGERNDRLAKVAGHLLRRYCDPYLAASLVQAWNLVKCDPPLPPGEVDKILESLADKELRRRKAVSQ